MTPDSTELQRWREVGELYLDAQTPEELETYLAVSGLSITVHGGYGEWGCETLACLFAELGIQPGDDLQSAVDHARASAIAHSEASRDVKEGM